MRNEPLVLTLELLRKHEAGDPFAFSFQEQEYVRRREGGTVRSAVFPWNQGLLQDLANLEQREPDVGLIRRLGEVLRRFLEEIGWERDEQELTEALRRAQEVHFTVRAAAAEIYALPWELLTLRDSGQHLGQQRGCTVRYEWTGTPPRAPAKSSAEGRILFAWSAAGGEVPAGRHLTLLRETCRRGEHLFQEERDVLANVSLTSLSRELERSQRVGEPVAVLHLLSHGTQRERVGPDRRSSKEYGLVWNAAGPGEFGDFVVADRLKEVLEPHADTLRMVVLCACQGGQEQLGSHLGSVARELHRVGIAAVVASRLRLSVEGSVTLAETLYGGLLGVPDSSEAPLEAPRSLEAALGSARKRLRELGLMDWASLQLYACAGAGPGIRPLPIRPYRGLLAFEPAHRRFFFGRSDLEQQLVERARAAMEGRGPRFLVVAGASGSGKSSLVLAGLVPRLREVGGGGWDTRVMQPSEAGSHRVSEGPGRFGTLGMLRELLYRLHRTGEAPTFPGASAEEIIHEARLLRSVRPGRCLLLVVDQFEEVFTQVTAAEEREAFVRTLWELAREDALQVLVVATLRVDAFERCGEVRVSPEGLRLDSVVYSDSHRLFVSQLQARQLSEIIEEPARAVGLEFEPGLAEVLRRDVEQEPGALPLLEHALDQLWERRLGHRLTQAAYLEIGGVAGAIARTGEHLHDELPEAEQHQARRLLVKLVDLRDETSPHTRRREWLKTVRPSQEEASAAFDSVVEKLVRRRLVVKGADRDMPGRPSETWLQIAHEALIRRWDRLVRWVQEDRERELQVREVEAWARDWREHCGSPDGGSSYLASGERLAYALEVGRKHPEALSERAQEFLACSREMEARRFQEEKENQAAALDVSRVLMARRLLEKNPTLAALVLREVVEPEKVPEWRQAVIETLQRPLIITMLHYGEGCEPGSIITDGRRVIAKHDSGSVWVWYVGGSNAPVVLHGHTGEVVSTKFSLDGQSVITASKDGTVRVWKVDGSGGTVVFRDRASGMGFAAFSPDGQYVVTVSRNGMARVRRLDGDGEPVERQGDALELNSAAFSPDGQYVVTASELGTIRVWRADGSGKPVLLRGHTGGVVSAEFSPDGQYVVSASRDGTACVWRANGSGKPMVFKGHKRALVAASFSPDGLRILTASWDGTVLLRNVDGTGEPIALQGHAVEIGLNSAAFSPDGRHVVTTSRDGMVRVWGANGPGTPVVFLGYMGGELSNAFSADGLHLLTTCADGSVCVCRVDGFGEPVVLQGHKKGVRFAAFSPDGACVLTVSNDRTARIWRMDGSSESVVLRGHKAAITAAAFSADGTRVVTVSMDGTVRVWRGDGTGKSLVMRGKDEWVRFVVLSADGTCVGAVSEDGTAHIWRVGASSEAVALQGHIRGRPSNAFSADGMRAVTGSSDGKVWVWRLDEPNKPLEISGNKGGIRSVAISPDGLFVISVPWEGGAEVWRVDGARQPVLLQEYNGGLRLEAISPDGSCVAMIARDGTASVWRVDGIGHPVVLHGHERGVLCAAFSPDSQRVVTASRDGMVRVWRTDGSGEPVVIHGHEGGRVLSAAFSSDGQRVAIASEDGCIRLWTIGTDRLQMLLREATTATLTPEQRQRYLLETPEARAGHARSGGERGRTPPAPSPA